MYDGNYEEMVGSAFSQLLPVLFLLMNDNTLRFNQVFLPNTGEESVLLVDSWGGFKQMAHETDTTKNITIKYIPEGTTGLVQPWNRYGARPWKNYTRRLSELLTKAEPETNLHERNNIIKWQSLAYNQLSPPR